MKRKPFFPLLLFGLLLLIGVGACDPCKDSNCQNGGVCEDGDCQCPPGYTGASCEIQLEPNADFSANRTTLPAGETVQFTDRSTSNPDKWEWTFSGGVPASFVGQNPPPIRYDKCGEFTVKLTVTNSGGSRSATLKITVTPGPNKIAYETLIAGGLGGRFPDANSRKNVRFARYAVVSSSEDVHVLSRENGSYQAYTWSDMKAQLDIYYAQLSPATWVGEDGNWVVVFGGNGYRQKGLPSALLADMLAANQKGRQFIRIDRDSDGRFAFLHSGGFSSDSYITEFNNLLFASSNSLIGFAFGSGKSWAAISKNNYWTSANAPAGLKNKLAEIKNTGCEFVDIEIGQNGWIVVYK